MRVTRFFLIISILYFFIGCTNNASDQENDDQGKILVEIESLSKMGIEIPEIITPEDIEKCEQAINMARAISNSELELKCLIQLFEFQNEAENYKDALEIGFLALDLAKESGHKESLANIYHLLGRNYYHLAHFPKAFENLEVALKLYRELNDTVNIQDVMNLQANIYSSYNDYDMAYSYYEQNLEISRIRDDNVSIAKALTNIGLIYLNRSLESELSGDSVNYFSQQAIEYINNALLFNKKTNNRHLTSKILLNLADVYLNSGDTEKALIIIKDAMNISKGLSDRTYIWATISYANILVELDSLSEAEKILLSTLELAKNSDIKQAMINIYSILSTIYDNQGEYKLAYSNYRWYSYYSESIFNLDHKKQIDAIKIASSEEAKAKQLEIERQYTYYKIISIIFLVVLVVVIGLLFYSRLKQRAKNINLENSLLAERIKSRDRELANRIMALIQRSELEKDIIKKLNLLKIKLKREDQKEVYDIVRSLSSRQNDQLWKEFEIRFESAHQEFYTKLSHEFPDLTTNERRLCAFLYRDMSSKDISAITGQSVRALNVARTRLRKRFNLTNDSQSIAGYLNSM